MMSVPVREKIDESTSLIYEYSHRENYQWDNSANDGEHHIISHRVDDVGITSFSCVPARSGDPAMDHRAIIENL